MLKETTESTGSFGAMPQEPRHPRKSAKPDCIIQLNFREVGTHASCKTTRTWESFNNWETKMSLLSDKLWLIPNNSKIFLRKNSKFCCLVEKRYVWRSWQYFQELTWNFLKWCRQEWLPQRYKINKEKQNTFFVI